jgi:hypothetical protein
MQNQTIKVQIDDLTVDLGTPSPSDAFLITEGYAECARYKNAVIGVASQHLLLKTTLRALQYQGRPYLLQFHTPEELTRDCVIALVDWIDPSTLEKLLLMAIQRAYPTPVDTLDNKGNPLEDVTLLPAKNAHLN